MKKKVKINLKKKNWQPISLLNVDYKIALKALAEKPKKILPVLMSHEKTAYVRFICETGILISDIIEVSNAFNIDRLWFIKSLFSSCFTLNI